MVKLQKLFVVQRTGIKRVKIVFKLTSKGTRKSIWSESRSVHEDEIRVGCSGGEREDKKKEQACGMPVKRALRSRTPLHRDNSSIRACLHQGEQRCLSVERAEASERAITSGLIDPSF